MAAKSRHKHLYVKHIVRKEGTSESVGWDVVNVCSVCGYVKSLSFKERTVKVNGYSVWPCSHDDIVKYFGDLPRLS